MDIDNLMEKIWSKEQDIINKEYEITEYKRKISELESKVYAYEKIIANSNFAPIISNEKSDLKEKNKWA